VALGTVGGVHGVAITVEPLLDSAPLRDRPGDLRRRAERDGCLFFRELVDASAIRALAEIVRAECRAVGFAEGDRARAGLAPIAYDDPDFVALQCTVLATPEFAAVGDSPAILEVLEAVHEAPVATRRGDLCRVAVPGHPDRATLPHQDHYYVGGRTDIWTVWLPLTDCPRSLGPLLVLPGSHRGGVLPHDVRASGVQGVVVPEDATWAGADLRVGDALMFGSLTVHRSLPNLSGDRLRLSVDYRYEPKGGVRAVLSELDRPT
jgi:hypothetical protein